jgi:ribosomal protein S1
MIISEPLKKGAIVGGFVTRITNFGAFIDLGGIDGLLHISQISWQQMKHPAEILRIGEQVRVVVLKIDPLGKRISLGRKQLLDRRADRTTEKQRRSNFSLWESMRETEDAEREMREQHSKIRLLRSRKHIKIVPGGLPSLGRKK